MNELRVAWRQLWKTPGVTLIAVLTLALGIGGSTAIFSVVDAVLLGALPYPDASRVVQVFETVPGGGMNSVSGGAFKDWQAERREFSHLAVLESVRRNLSGDGDPEEIPGLLVSTEFLGALGMPPALGRDFAPGEDSTSGHQPVVILSDALWQRRFNSDPQVLGRTLVLNQVPHTVIGVARPGATLLDSAMFLTPIVIDGKPDEWGRSGHWRSVIGRLAPDTTVAQAQLALRSVKQRLDSEYPPFKHDWSVAVMPLQDVMARDAKPTLLTLFATVAIVLLIGCANVSNLLLARGNARFREMAVRTALGASQRRIVRQLLSESLLLAGLGCALGLLLALAGIGVLTDMIAGLLPQIVQPTMNLTVLAFSIGTALVCGLGFGMLPALRASKPDLVRDLRESERGAVSGSRRRAQSMLIAAEFAFTLVLLVGAGLFVRSFARMLDVDTGFRPTDRLAFDLTFPDAKYPTVADRQAFIDTVLSRVEALPGVQSAGASTALPLSGRGWTEYATRAEAPPETDYVVGTDFISGDYFEAIGMHLQQGRLLETADQRAGAAKVIVIDAGVARDLFANENPIGHRLRVIDEEWEIVGVVAAVRHDAIDMDPRPRVFAPQGSKLQGDSVVVRENSIVVHSSLAPSALAATLRETVLSLDPDQPIANVRTLTQAIGQSLAVQRTTVTLLGLFALVALVMACIGIYGVVSQAVGQRRREISIRAALGATRGDLTRLVLGGGLRPSLAGMAVGVGIALVGARLVGSLLFEVDSADPLVYVSALVLLTTMAVLAILLPARRAATAHPISALRNE
jgi:putative ABC transport system permease protein